MDQNQQATQALAELAHSLHGAVFDELLKGLAAGAAATSANGVLEADVEDQRQQNEGKQNQDTTAVNNNGLYRRNNYRELCRFETDEEFNQWMAAENKNWGIVQKGRATIEDLIDQYACVYKRRKGYSCRATMRVRHSRLNGRKLIEISTIGHNHEYSKELHHSQNAERARQNAAESTANCTSSAPSGAGGSGRQSAKLLTPPNNAQQQQFSFGGKGCDQVLLDPAESVSPKSSSANNSPPSPPEHQQQFFNNSVFNSNSKRRYSNIESITGSASTNPRPPPTFVDDFVQQQLGHQLGPFWANLFAVNQHSNLGDNFFQQQQNHNNNHLINNNVDFFGKFDQQRLNGFTDSSRQKRHLDAEFVRRKDRMDETKEDAFPRQESQQIPMESETEAAGHLMSNLAEAITEKVLAQLEPRLDSKFEAMLGAVSTLTKSVDEMKRQQQELVAKALPYIALICGNGLMLQRQQQPKSANEEQNIGMVESNNEQISPNFFGEPEKMGKPQENQKSQEQHCMSFSSPSSENFLLDKRQSKRHVNRQSQASDAQNGSIIDDSAFRNLEGDQKQKQDSPPKQLPFADENLKKEDDNAEKMLLQRWFHDQYHPKQKQGGLAEEQIPSLVSNKNKTKRPFSSSRDLSASKKLLLQHKPSRKANSIRKSVQAYRQRRRELSYRHFKEVGIMLTIDGVSKSLFQWDPEEIQKAVQKKRLELLEARKKVVFQGKDITEMIYRVDCSRELVNGRRCGQMVADALWEQGFFQTKMMMPILRGVYHRTKRRVNGSSREPIDEDQFEIFKVALLLLGGFLMDEVDRFRWMETAREGVNQRGLDELSNSKRAHFHYEGGAVFSEDTNKELCWNVYPPDEVIQNYAEAAAYLFPNQPQTILDSLELMERLYSAEGTSPSDGGQSTGAEFYAPSSNNYCFGDGMMDGTQQNNLLLMMDSNSEENRVDSTMFEEMSGDFHLDSIPGGCGGSQNASSSDELLFGGSNLDRLISLNEQRNNGTASLLTA